MCQMTDRDGEVWFNKRIEIEKGFYIQMAEFPERSRGEVVGFGITAGRDGIDDFSWEWFNIEDETRAVKLQETGELAYHAVVIDSRWEIGRTEVTSDISLRVYDRGTDNVRRNTPTWRIRLEKGSYVNWPSILREIVVVHELPASATRHN